MVDPPAPSIGYQLPALTADVVTISHNHPDHNNSTGVRGSFALVDGRPTTERAEVSAAGMQFVLVPGFHDNTNGSTRGPNTIVRWTQAGVRFAHFGDYGQDSLTPAQLADLRDIDVLMVPAGGSLTIGGTQTAALIAQLNPRVAILMHYRTALGGPAQLAMLPAVTAPFPQIRYKPATLALDRASLPPSTEVWLMEPASDTVVVNVAGFTAGAPVAPLSATSVLGNFTGSATAAYTNFPLARKLAETEVFIGDTSAPLFYVSPTQINFQVPAGLQPGQNILDVRVAGQRVARGTITTLAHSPGLFPGATLSIVKNGTSSRRFITIYGSGQGAVTPAIAEGVAAPVNPLSTSNDEPAVFIDGRRLAVTFSGLAPGFVGLWQINALIPDDFQGGVNLPVEVLFESNVVSNAIRITLE